MLLHRLLGETWPGAFRWWVGLCLVTVVNVCAWAFAALVFRRRRVGKIDPETYNFAAHAASAVRGVRHRVRGFRSVFPARRRVQRICLHDSWLSSVGVGRSLATIAELCFIAQWAILLRELGESTRTRIAVTRCRRCWCR